MKENFEVISLVLGPVGTNTYIFFNQKYVTPDGKQHAVIIDPADNGKGLHQLCEEKGIVIDAVLLTHAHFDHIGGVNELRTLTDAPVYCGADEQELCEDPALNVSLDFGERCTVHPDNTLADGEEVELAGLKGRVIFTPGHTKGSVCFYFEEAEVLFSGDTLFEQSVGRSDLPTGSMSELVRSIREKLLVLPEETIVFPGHMGTTTIGFEKKNNPFI